MTHSNKKRMRPLLLVATVVMIIIAVNLHAVGAILLSKTGFGVFSLSNPISYVLIGLFFVAAMFKLKHLLGFMHRKEKQSAREITNGLSSTGGVQHEQSRE